ncbi:hypothetical protein FPV67DRAFT_1767925 [Lyophyllum atratum]|nr:hypothetical protein FPV67DRAFT_1767925 [Lyophyllum atratum]
MLEIGSPNVMGEMHKGTRLLDSVADGTQEIGNAASGSMLSASWLQNKQPERTFAPAMTSMGKEHEVLGLLQWSQRKFITRESCPTGCAALCWLRLHGTRRAGGEVAVLCPGTRSEEERGNRRVVVVSDRESLEGLGRTSDASIDDQPGRNTSHGVLGVSCSAPNAGTIGKVAEFELCAINERMRASKIKKYGAGQSGAWSAGNICLASPWTSQQAGRTSTKARKYRGGVSAVRTSEVQAALEMIAIRSELELQVHMSNSEMSPTDVYSKVHQMSKDPRPAINVIPAGGISAHETSSGPTISG